MKAINHHETQRGNKFNDDRRRLIIGIEEGIICSTVFLLRRRNMKTQINKNLKYLI